MFYPRSKESKYLLSEFRANSYKLVTADSTVYKIPGPVLGEERCRDQDLGWDGSELSMCKGRGGKYGEERKVGKEREKELGQTLLRTIAQE